MEGGVISKMENFYLEFSHSLLGKDGFADM